MRTVILEVQPTFAKASAGKGSRFDVQGSMFNVQFSMFQVRGSTFDVQGCCRPARRSFLDQRSFSEVGSGGGFQVAGLGGTQILMLVMICCDFR